jgi:hypothetical protein
MFTGLDVSLVRERNEWLLRKVQADRLGERQRANRGSRPGWRQTVGALMARGFAGPPACQVRRQG